jgi:hypothetical protein
MTYDNSSSKEASSSKDNDEKNSTYHDSSSKEASSSKYKLDKKNPRFTPIALPVLITHHGSPSEVGSSKRKPDHSNVAHGEKASSEPDKNLLR